MSLKLFGLMLLMCLVWGLHFVVIKVVVTDIAPPLFYVAVRMTLIALVLLPFFKWHAGKMKRLLIAGVCFGGLNYALLFTGIKLANASIAAVVIEAYAPITMLLSVLFLKETVGWRRLMGLVLAMFGILMVMSGSEDLRTGDEDGSRFILGIVFVLGGALTEAIGALTVKKLDGVKPIELLGWFAIVGVFISWPATLLFEQGQLQSLAPDSRGFFIAGICYSVFAASIFGHTTYYYLIQNLPLSQISGATLLATIIAIFGGVFILNEPMTTSLIVGTIFTLTGVGIILLRNNSDVKPTFIEITPAILPEPTAGNVSDTIKEEERSL